jgi:hypothetical protein
MNINITRRKRRRKQRDGSIKWQVRWVVSWHNAGRHQRFFASRAEAIEFRNRLLVDGKPAKPTNATVGDAIATWLEGKKRTTQANTAATYGFRAKLLDSLFQVRVDKLTTKDIRSWHNSVAGTGTVYSANKALVY